MRLREPFSGYMLIEGHVVTHLAMLAGCFNVYYIIYNGDIEDLENGKWTFRFLVASHILTPIAIFCRSWSMTNGYYVLAKLIQITSVILNTLSIFYAQFV